MNLKQELNLQLFADAGTLVNASGNYVNAYSTQAGAACRTRQDRGMAQVEHA